MPIDVDADCALLNLLTVLPEVSVQDLKRFRGIMSRYVPDVYVDVTDDGVTGAISDHPGLFSETDNIISLRKRVSRKTVEYRYNAFLPRDTREAIRKTLKRMKPKKES